MTRLLSTGINLDEAQVVSRIVTALPENIHAFKKAWDSVPDDCQTMPALLARLRKEELEMKIEEKEDGTENGNGASAYAARNFSKQPFHNNKGRKNQIDELKKKTKCKNCGKVGH